MHLEDFVWNCPQVNATKLINEESPVVKVMAWCHLAMSHYMYACRPFAHWKLSSSVQTIDPFSLTHYIRAECGFAPSQWEMALLCNNVSHWLGVSLESTLLHYLYIFLNTITFRVLKVWLKKTNCSLIKPDNHCPKEIMQHLDPFSVACSEEAQTMLSQSQAKSLK